MTLTQLLQLPPSDLKRVLTPIISAANKDQKKLVDKYNRTVNKSKKK